jgi:hypothetical protein
MVLFPLLFFGTTIVEDLTFFAGTKKVNKENAFVISKLFGAPNNSCLFDGAEITFCKLFSLRLLI